jgi:hypothetical protein
MFTVSKKWRIDFTPAVEPVFNLDALSNLPRLVLFMAVKNSK